MTRTMPLTMMQQCQRPATANRAERTTGSTRTALPALQTMPIPYGQLTMAALTTATLLYHRHPPRASP
jgi:hypothetical protein